jgi:hypothetical protein
VNPRQAWTIAGLMLGLVPALAATRAPAGEMPQEPSLQSESSILPGQPDAGKPAVDLSVHFIAKQRPDDVLATDLIGRPAVDAANETIGDVNDLVTDGSGKTIAAVVGVGGFLGIGEKDVAIPFEDLRFSRDQDNDVTIEVDIDKDALTAAPDYQSLDDQAALESAAKSSGGDKTHY